MWEEISVLGIYCFYLILLIGIWYIAIAFKSCLWIGRRCIFNHLFYINYFLMYNATCSLGIENHKSKLKYSQNRTMESNCLAYLRGAICEYFKQVALTTACIFVPLLFMCVRVFGWVHVGQPDVLFLRSCPPCFWRWDSSWEIGQEARWHVRELHRSICASLGL